MAKGCRERPIARCNLLLRRHRPTRIQESLIALHTGVCCCRVQCSRSSGWTCSGAALDQLMEQARQTRAIGRRLSTISSEHHASHQKAKEWRISLPSAERKSSACEISLKHAKCGFFRSVEHGLKTSACSVWSSCDFLRTSIPSAAHSRNSNKHLITHNTLPTLSFPTPLAFPPSSLPPPSLLEVDIEGWS